MRLADGKLASDRKLLREIDLNIARQSLVMIVCQLVLFVVLALHQSTYLEFPEATLIIGVMLLVIGALRTSFFLQFDFYYGKGPSRWRRLMMLMHIFHSSVWGSLTFMTLAVYELQPSGVLLIVFTIGYGILATGVWAPYLQANRFSVVVTLLPISAALVVNPSTQNVIIALLVLGYAITLLQRAGNAYSRYWETLDLAQQLKRRTLDLEHARLEADTANSVKIDFLGNLTHEIRTPMNNVLGMLSLMRDTKLDQNQSEMLNVASHSGQNLLTLIDDILDFSKISSGSVILDSVVFNLRKCVEEVIELVGPMAHEKKLELSVVFDKDMPLRVRGDSGRIAQVIQNLAINAIKFSEEGEVVVSVHLTRLSNLQGLLRVHVTDEGDGISQDQQARLFDAFYRTDASTTRLAGGTGLGLAICKGLVERMEGKIGLLSELGRGSTFWFTAQVTLSTQQKQNNLVRQKFNGIRALLVNAPQGMLQGLSNDLDVFDIQLENINDSDKALQTLRLSAREGLGFRLVILNFAFHYAGTFKLSRIIAEDPLLQGTKQIILTTLEHRGSSDAVFHNERIDDLVYLTKPIQRHALVDGLVELFEGGKKKNVMMDIKPLESVVGGQNTFNVLLVEDNQVNQTVAKGMLKRLGYAVKVVCNGKEALSILKDKRFDLILMDCQMPVMDGYEATRLIRQQEQAANRKAIPIIAMTANSMEGAETKCLASGMDDYLAKPVNVRELDAKLRNWLERNSATDTRGILNFGQKGGSSDEL